MASAIRPEIDTANRFMVARSKDRLFIMRPPPPAFSDDDALNLAAWLVAMVDTSAGNPVDRFSDVLYKILNT